MPDILEEYGFDVGSFADELTDATTDVGTTLLFENGRVRVWEVRLAPGTRCPFHAHTRPYFWTCVIAGTGRQRSGDGTLRVLRYAVGDTSFWEPGDTATLLHDLENVGDTEIRFVTVELR